MNFYGGIGKALIMVLAKGVFIVGASIWLDISPIKVFLVIQASFWAGGIFSWWLLQGNAH